ncbi:MAG TPA: hypothetical protein VMZ31_06655 [Phycisphaerae bacterium]|nr:hypothetical protein [Phycisphaerae bacterium]
MASKTLSARLLLLSVVSLLSAGCGLGDIDVPSVPREGQWLGAWDAGEQTAGECEDCGTLSFEVVHDAAGEQAFMRNVTVTYRRVRGAVGGTYYEGTVELPADTLIEIQEDRSFEVSDPNVELSGVLAYWISGFPGLGFSTQDIGLGSLRVYVDGYDGWLESDWTAFPQ